MKWFKNKRISVKLIIGFLIVAIIAAVIGGIGVINISVIGKADAQILHENVDGFGHLATAQICYQRIRFNVVKALIGGGTSVEEEARAQIRDYITAAEENLAIYRAAVDLEEERQAFDTFKKEYDAYLSSVNNVLGLIQSQKYEDAQNMILGDLGEAGNSVQALFDQMFESMRTEGEERQTENERTVSLATVLMIAIAAAGVVIALILGAYISRLIGRPLKTMAVNARKLALGHVDIDIKADTKDEIGELAEAFKEVINVRKIQVHETQRLASGDLTVDITKKSDKDVLGGSLITLVDNLNEMVVAIRNSAEQVASGSNLVSQTSMALSQGAAEQASSVEQLTASLQEIASQTTQNAQNAQSANKYAKNAREGAELGNTQMKDMLGAMDQINQSSASINKIIKVIDDIAFQTNILALNAAVEAARAGQHGKGFAVVAEEVRTLAARSAQAAKETTDLIEGSIKKVEAGTKIANQTAEALGKIVNEVAKAADLVEEIAAASNEQATAIEQVNQGVIMVSTVVQSNAATSEESAAASEELSSQADQLKEIIGQFKVKQDAPKGMGADIQKAGQRNNDTFQSAGGRKPIQTPKRTISLGEGDFGKY